MDFNALLVAGIDQNKYSTYTFNMFMVNKSNKMLMKPALLLSVLPQLALAAMMTNNISGVGPQGKIKPWICIQDQSGNVGLKLAPQQSGDANKASGNLYYAGATIRFDGCDAANTYLGYVGFSISASGPNAIASYQAPDGVHVTYAQPNIDAQGRVSGAIKYTPIQTNANFIPAEPARHWLFAGINLSGLEFGKTIDPVVVPNLSQQDSAAKNSDLNDSEAFIKAGMNTVRVPISWGYVQLDGAGKGELNLEYYENYIKPLLQTLTHAQVYTIIDLHAYMRYSKFGEQYSGCGATGKCPDGTLIEDEQAYQSVWGKLATLIQQDPEINKNYILFDLMNEPVGVSGDKVFTIQASVIKMLRANKFAGYILVEGNNWSGLHSWLSTPWTGANNQTYCNGSLFTRENFAKAGITDLSKIVINVHQYLDSDYSGTHDDCLQDLTSEGPNGFNLQAFVDYLQKNQLNAMVTEFGVGKNSASCSAPLNQFLHYLQDNSASNHKNGFLGWAVWSTGHGWGDYNLRVKPDSYSMQILQDYL